MDDVVEAIRNAKRRGKKCVLLIGAGCSASGGIPTANGFVDIIKKDWKSAYARAAEKVFPAEPSYPLCMSELSDAERRDLIAEYVERAKINWAHIAIAQLMKEGFVDRVFTTNFDPLVLRACAMVNVFPAVYDFAASQHFKAAYLPPRSVFHLHGQHTGFILLHTKEDVEQLSASISLDEIRRLFFTQYPIQNMLAWFVVPVRFLTMPDFEGCAMTRTIFSRFWRNVWPAFHPSSSKGRSAT